MKDGIEKMVSHLDGLKYIFNFINLKTGCLLYQNINLINLTDAFGYF